MGQFCAKSRDKRPDLDDLPQLENDTDSDSDDESCTGGHSVSYSSTYGLTLPRRIQSTPTFPIFDLSDSDDSLCYDSE